MAENENASHALRTGWRAVTALRGLALLIVMVTVGMMIFGPLSAVFPLMTYNHFGGDGYAASLTEAAFGVGLLAGSTTPIGVALGSMLADAVGIAPFFLIDGCYDQRYIYRCAQ